MEVKEEMEKVEEKTSGRHLCPVSSDQSVGMINKGPLSVSEVNTVTAA